MIYEQNNSIESMQAHLLHLSHLVSKLFAHTLCSLFPPVLIDRLLAANDSNGTAALISTGHNHSSSRAKVNVNSLVQQFVCLCAAVEEGCQTRTSEN